VGRNGVIAVVLVLLGGSVAAFAWTEKLKVSPVPVTKVRFVRHFSPTCECRRSTARLIFQVRHPERLDVSIVDADDSHVATLAKGRDLSEGRVTFEWDGRDDDGRVVPDGPYRAKVRLEDDRRTILIPGPINVDTVPPRARVLSLQSGTGLDLRYASSEAARPFLLVDGKIVFRGERTHAGKAGLEWPGPWPGSGPHTASLVLVDRAGNRSLPTTPIIVQAP
jgi:FlgD Ig-like domain